MIGSVYLLLLVPNMVLMTLTYVQASVMPGRSKGKLYFVSFDNLMVTSVYLLLVPSAILITLAYVYIQ